MMTLMTLFWYNTRVCWTDRQTDRHIHVRTDISAIAISGVAFLHGLFYIALVKIACEYLHVLDIICSNGPSQQDNNDKSEKQFWRHRSPSCSERTQTLYSNKSWQTDTAEWNEQRIFLAVYIYGGPKKVSHNIPRITLSNTGRFSKSFHSHFLRKFEIKRSSHLTLNVSLHYVVKY